MCDCACVSVRVCVNNGGGCTDAYMCESGRLLLCEKVCVCVSMLCVCLCAGARMYARACDCWRILKLLYLVMIVTLT